MSLVVDVFKPRLLAALKKLPPQEELAKLKVDVAGCRKDIAMLVEEPLKYYKAHFASSMEQIDELDPRMQARLDDEATRLRDFIATGERRINVLGPQI